MTVIAAYLYKNGQRMRDKDEVGRFGGDRIYLHLLVCKVQTVTLAMMEVWP